MKSPSYSSELHQLLLDAQQFSEELEKNQAQAPLQAHFAQIQSDLAQAPFNVILVGLTAAARSSALAWLYGPDFSVLTVQVIESLGLVEIGLRERGYALERGNGQRLEFDHLPAFLNALGSSDLLGPFDGDQWLDPVRLGIERPPSLQGLQVFLPQSPQLLLQNPALLNRLVRQSNMVLLAAPLHHALTGEEQQAIQSLSQNVTAIWPLLLVDELAEGLSIPRPGWWDAPLGPALRLPAKLLTTHVAADLPGLFRDRADPLRESLFEQWQAQRLEQAIEAIDERLNQDLKQLQLRQRREQARLGPAAGFQTTVADRGPWEGLKQQWTAALQRAQRALAESGKRALLPDAPMMVALKQRLSQLTPSDLDQQHGHQHITLTLNREALAGLEDLIRGQLKQGLVIDTRQLNEALHLASGELNEAISSGTQRAQSLPPPVLDSEALWALLKGHINLNVRYRGEMPRRGLMARLSDGRRAIMGLAMVAMVLGGLFKAVWGVDFRAGVMLVAPLIFLVAVVYSYWVWPKEDAERLKKEMDRLRDGLDQEIRRLLQEAQREKQQQLQQALEEVRLPMLQRLDELQRQTQMQQQQDQQQHREQAQQRLMQIDQQQRRLQQWQRQTQTLLRQARLLVQQGLKRLTPLVKNR